MSSAHCSSCSCAQHESEPPSLSHLRNITPEDANHITDIDLDVLGTHDLITKLHHFRAFRSRQRNAFVPAVNLPPEVLTTIFEFACCPDGDSYTVIDCALTPLFIGSICSMWRSIAWCAPRLWNSITLLYYDDDAETLAEMLDYWLSKSGELPLTVNLVEDDSEIYRMMDASLEVIEVIAAYAHRLHTVDLFLPGSWMPALVRIASCMPLLTRIALRTPVNGYRRNPTIEVTDLFANASQLRDVTLFGYCAADVVLPWAQLESLDSGYESIFELVETFVICRGLRRFSFYVGDLFWTEPPSVLMRHTMLETLEISGYDEDVHPEFLTMLELPVLRSFILEVSSMRPSEWSSWLPPFLSRVAGTLETLHLSPAVPLDEELRTVLGVVPRLRKLVLLNSLSQQKKLTQRTLDLMNPTKYELLEYERIGQLNGQGGVDEAGTTGSEERSNRHCLVPNLEMFDYEGAVDFTSHALVEFLVARCRGRSTTSGCSSILRLENPQQQVEGSRQQAAHEPLPPDVDAPLARLRSATFKTPEQIRFEDADVEVVQELRLEGMHLNFLECSY